MPAPIDLVVLAGVGVLLIAAGQWLKAKRRGARRWRKELF